MKSKISVIAACAAIIPAFANTTVNTSWTQLGWATSGEVSSSGISAANTDYVIDVDVDNLVVSATYVTPAASSTVTFTGKPITYSAKDIDASGWPKGHNFAMGTGKVTFENEIVLQEGVHSFKGVASGLHFKGVISGPGQFMVGAVGGSNCGSEIYLYGNNTFTGGTEIQAGCHVNACTVNAFGANVKGTTAQVVLRDTGYVIFQGTAVGDVHYPFVCRNDYTSVQSTVYNLRVWGLNTRICGPITGVGAGGSVGLGNSAAGYEIAGSVTVPDTGWLVVQTGANFKGPVAAKRIWNDAATTTGNYSLWNATNRLCDLHLNVLSASCQAGNVLSGAVVRFDGDYDDSKGRLVLNGYNETIDRFVLGSGEAACTHQNGRRVISGKSGAEPNALTLKATGDSVTSARFEGFMDLVWDPAGDFTFMTGSDRVHTLAGGVVVSGGVFKVTGATSFLQAQKLDVAANATFDASEATATVFANSRITVKAETGAVIRLPSGATLSVLGLTLDGEIIPPGTYTGSDVADTAQGVGTLSVLRGTARISVTGPTVTPVPGTWSAGSGSAVATDPANWGLTTVPDFGAGTFRATFATAGTEALFTGDVSLYGLVFTGPSFAVDVTGCSDFKLGAGGVTVESPAAEAADPLPVYEVKGDVTLSAPQGWGGGSSTNATLVLTGSLAGESYAVVNKTSGCRLVVDGGTGGSTYAGNFTRSDGDLALKGVNPFGTTGSLFVNNANRKLVLDGVELAKRLVLNVYSGTQTVFVPDGRSVRFKGPVVHAGAARWSLGASQVSFEGGFENSSDAWQTVWWSDDAEADVYVKTTPFDFGCEKHPTGVFNAQFITRDGTWHFQVPDNKIRHFYFYGAAKVLCETDWAFNSTNTIVDWNFGTGTLDLQGHPVRVGSIVSAKSGGRIVNSAAKKADLYVTMADAASSVNLSSTNDTALIGAIDFHKAGVHDLAFRHPVCATGAVEVTEGRLVLTEEAVWAGATSVVVRATAATDPDGPPALEVGTARPFRRRYALTVGQTAKIVLKMSSDAIHTVGTLDIEDSQGELRRVRPGLYPLSAPELGGRFEGGGCVRVSGGGLVVIVR